MLHVTSVEKVKDTVPAWTCFHLHTSTVTPQTIPGADLPLTISFSFPFETASFHADVSGNSDESLVFKVFDDSENALRKRTSPLEIGWACSKKRRLLQAIAFDEIPANESYTVKRFGLMKEFIQFNDAVIAELNKCCPRVTSSELLLLENRPLSEYQA